MSYRISAEQAKKQIQAGGQTFLPHHDCSLCGVTVGYVIRGDDVYYRSACGCSSADGFHESNWGEIADDVNMQQTDDIAAKVARRFGLTFEGMPQGDGE